MWEKKVNALVHCIAQILYARNLNVVTPFAFFRNLTQYAATKSKICASLMGSWEPAGSYTTLHNFTCSPVDPPNCPFDDIHVTIDNNQKISKSSGSNLSEGAKVPVEVCTTVGYISPGLPTHLQKEPALKPSMWQDTLSLAEKLDKVDMLEKALKNFRLYRSNILDEKIQQVISEHDAGNVYAQDHVDLSVRNERLNSVCGPCKFVYPKQSETICPKCKFDFVHHPPDYDPYWRSKSQHPDYPAVIMAGDPCLVNPNSMKNVQECLNHLHDTTNISKDREWVVLWSDDVPYQFACQLQERMFRCKFCTAIVDLQQESFDSHNQLHDNENVDNNNYEKIFDFVILKNWTRAF